MEGLESNHLSFDVSSFKVARKQS